MHGYEQNEFVGSILFVQVWIAVVATWKVKFWSQLNMKWEREWLFQKWQSGFRTEAQASSLTLSIKNMLFSFILLFAVTE